jgi:Helix-turn-helix domain
VTPAPLHTLRSAAAWLSISEHTLRVHCRHGRIAHIRLGGDLGPIRFTEWHLQEFIMRGEVGVKGPVEPKIQLPRLKWVKMPARQHP